MFNYKKKFECSHTKWMLWIFRDAVDIQRYSPWPQQVQSRVGNRAVHGRVYKVVQMKCTVIATGVQPRGQTYSHSEKFEELSFQQMMVSRNMWILFQVKQKNGKTGEKIQELFQEWWGISSKVCYWDIDSSFDLKGQLRELLVHLFFGGRDSWYKKIFFLFEMDREYMNSLLRWSGRIFQILSETKKHFQGSKQRDFCHIL